MNIKNNLQYDNKELELLKNKLFHINQCANIRKHTPDYHLDVPIAVGLKLTNRCNLRCIHCFEWSKNGYHRSLSSECLNVDSDLDINIVSKLIEWTNKTNAPIYLWGGEPTIYKYWDKMIELLAQSNRKVIICTNGIGLEQKVHSLCQLKNNITLLFSIEGFQKEHDYLRGTGCFERVMKSLDFFLSMKKNGNFLGNISIETVVADKLIPNLEQYCVFMEEKGIDTLFLNFPWYIPEEIAIKMDIYYENKFQNIYGNFSKPYSWHSFDFHISPELFPTLIHQLSLIKERIWNNHIVCHPNFSNTDEMIKYLEGNPIIIGNKKKCLAHSLRIDVMPDGSVIPCKKFPEFVVGNLNETPLDEIWNGLSYNFLRKRINEELMDICSKCELLYSYGK